MGLKIKYNDAGVGRENSNENGEKSDDGMAVR